jgi:SAM-dependent methyltransferase
MNLRLMQDSDPTFVDGSRNQVQRLYRAGLVPKHAVLDVGCSVGRTAIGLMADSQFQGTYVGFDVMPKQVGWARETLTPLDTRFTFRHLDMRNDRYNPNGSVERADLKFPVQDGRFGMACLFSVFTHFYKEDIALYLSELERTLRPGGRILATWFLFNDENRDVVQSQSAYPMKYQLDDVTLYNEEADRLRAIAFDETCVREMVRQAGLEVAFGTWAGGPGPDFQDEVYLRKPGRSAPQLPALGRARRKAGRILIRAGHRLASDN